MTLVVSSKGGKVRARANRDSPAFLTTAEALILALDSYLEVLALVGCGLKAKILSDPVRFFGDLNSTKRTILGLDCADFFSGVAFLTPAMFSLVLARSPRGRFEFFDWNWTPSDDKFSLPVGAPGISCSKETLWAGRLGGCRGARLGATANDFLEEVFF